MVHRSHRQGRTRPCCRRLPRRPPSAASTGPPARGSMPARCDRKPARRSSLRPANRRLRLPPTSGASGRRCLRMPDRLPERRLRPGTVWALRSCATC
jgi:hypothetical protein